MAVESRYNPCDTEFDFFKIYLIARNQHIANTVGNGFQSRSLCYEEPCPLYLKGWHVVPGDFKK